MILQCGIKNPVTGRIERRPLQIEALAQQRSKERAGVTGLGRTWPLLVIALGFGLTAVWTAFVAYEIADLLKLVL
jgi:hypothetical protein